MRGQPQNGDRRGSLGFIGATDCQHDRLLVSYAKEEGKEGPHGISVLCSGQAQPAGMGQASQGLARAPAGGESVNSELRAAGDPSPASAP